MRELNKQNNITLLVKNLDTGEMYDIISFQTNNKIQNLNGSNNKPNHLNKPINDFNALDLIKNFINIHFEPNIRDYTIKICYDYYSVILKR